MLTVLHAGGKFGGGGYKVSGGLHGVGVSVVNALVQAARGRDQARRLPLVPGVRDGRPDRPAGAGRAHRRDRHDTRFWANDDIFETTDYSFETIANRFREMAFLNKGLEIVVRDERPKAAEIAEAVDDDTVANDDRRRRPGRPAQHEAGGMERRFKYDRGLVDYVEHLNRRKDTANPTIINFEAETPESRPRAT